MDVVGVTKVRGCCTFLWVQDVRAPRRIVFARPYHCAACVGEMVRSAKLQKITVSGSFPMDRVRGVLAARRLELQDRWQRQLQAAAEAGFALDGGTAEVLPLLLEAADRALERRFRAVPPGTPPVLAQARAAAMQYSLLGDFLFDAVLEECPEMSATEQRLLSDALAHAAVEVLLHAALEREEEARRRESRRLAKVAHDLRNSVTAAQLRLDLLRRTGALADGAPAHALQAALARIRDGIEDTVLDEILTAGGLRFSRVRLGPVLQQARTDAGAGAHGKDLTLLLEKLAGRLEVEADARVVAPAIRGLFRAAVELARPGATIRCGAAAGPERARVALAVDSCRRLPGNRLAGLPSLGLARRAARAHGGSLSARVLPGEGCELRLELPRVQPH